MLHGWFYLYALIDPFTDAPFYIGLSRFPKERVRIHGHDKESSAMPRCRAIRAKGGVVGLHILKKYKTRKNGERAENAAILAMAGLVNKYPYGRATLARKNKNKCNTPCCIAR